MTIQAIPTPHTPRLTVSRNGFLARSTALSWPWNKDRLRAAPGTLPPTFADLALGLVDRSKPVIRVWCKDPLQREDTPVASPVVLAKTRTQGGDDSQPSAHSTPTPPQDPMQRERTGPLRNGNPRGNPNLAPRCGARTRRTGCPCRAPAMRNGRCRLHGGKSTGPRTAEGRARIRAARLRHGRCTAESRAFQRDITDLLRNSRELLSLARQAGPLDAEALRHLAPPDFGKYLMQREDAPTRRPPNLQFTQRYPVQREEPLKAQADARRPARIPDCPSSSGQAAPAAALLVVPIRRPILLARPIPHAP